MLKKLQILILNSQVKQLEHLDKLSNYYKMFLLILKLIKMFN